MIDQLCNKLLKQPQISEVDILLNAIFAESCSQCNVTSRTVGFNIHIGKLIFGPMESPCSVNRALQA